MLEGTYSAEDREYKDTEDFGYISASLFLEGTKNRAKVEALPEFEGYLRFKISVSPDEVPELQTDAAKALYKKLYAEKFPDRANNSISFPPVTVPDYEKAYKDILKREQKEADASDNTIIDVDPSELKSVDESAEEEKKPLRFKIKFKKKESKPQSSIKNLFKSEEPIVPNPAPQPSSAAINYDPQPAPQPVPQPEPQEQPQQAFEHPLDISDKVMLQIIKNAAYQAGLDAYFFQEPLNDLIKICYASNDGIENRRYLDDYLDPAGTYFPEPVIIPNKATPILYQPTICIQEDLLSTYMTWKKMPMVAPQMNDYIIGYVPDRLVTDVCYNSNEIVRQIDPTSSQLLKGSLVNVFTFLDANHPELSGIRWEFNSYSSPDRFILTPETIDSSTRGLIFYTARQTMNVQVVYDATANPRVAVYKKNVDAAQSAQDATNALKEKISKANPAKKQVAKKPAAKRTTPKKKSDEEQADAEAIQAAKK